MVLLRLDGSLLSLVAQIGPSSIGVAFTVHTKATAKISWGAKPTRIEQKGQFCIH